MTTHWQLAPRADDDLLTHLLTLRGISAAETDAFTNPPVPAVSVIQQEVGIDPAALSAALSLIDQARTQGRPVVIHGDYDVDGICATAILWEVLFFDLGYRHAHPFIPNRFDHGYGISRASIEAIREKHEHPLLISVDCGITGVDAVAYAKELGWEVIITDHHTPGEELPPADAVVHTTVLTGAGVSWVLAEQLRSAHGLTLGAAAPMELAAMSVVADMYPLRGVNRQFVSHGLRTMARTTRVGLQALIEVAGIAGKPITPGTVGWHIGPRLNAAGRIENALDALRLLCTRNTERALQLAEQLHVVNQERQALTVQSVEQAEEMVDPERMVQVVQHAEWHEGVIGLIAGRIKEAHYRPTLAITTAGDLAKGSARSIEGFNIIEALRELEELFEDVGGHPMAAGFSLKEENIPELIERLNAYAQEVLTEEDLVPTLSIDAELSLEDVTGDLMVVMAQLQPYGVGNPTPRFLFSGVPLHEVMTVGKEGDHFEISGRYCPAHARCSVVSSWCSCA